MHLLGEVVVIIVVFTQGERGFRGPPGPPGPTLEGTGGIITVQVPGPLFWAINESQMLNVFICVRCFGLFVIS